MFQRFKTAEITRAPNPERKKFKQLVETEDHASLPNNRGITGEVVAFNEAAFKPNRVTSPREGRVTEKASRCLTSGHCLNGYETVVSGRSANAI